MTIMARKTISITKSNIKYTRLQKVFGVLLGLSLLILGGWAIYKYPPTFILEILVILAMGLATLMIGGWMTGKRKWGLFLTILVLGLPILFRVNLLNIGTIAVWFLILGLISLIN